MRGVFDNQVALIAAAYEIDIELDLAALLLEPALDDGGCRMIPRST